MIPDKDGWRYRYSTDHGRHDGDDRFCRDRHTVFANGAPIKVRDCVESVSLEDCGVVVPMSIQSYNRSSLARLSVFHFV
jgi:hypothetical protein